MPPLKFVLTYIIIRLFVSELQQKTLLTMLFVIFVSSLFIYSSHIRKRSWKVTNRVFPQSPKANAWRNIRPYLLYTCKKTASFPFPIPTSTMACLNWSAVDNQLTNRPFRSSSGQSLVSHRGGPGSRPGRACGICGEQSGTGAGFLWVLRFPLPIITPPISPWSSSPGASTIGLLVVGVPSGPNWTPPPSHYTN
jgi:hypothetical protein